MVWGLGFEDLAGTLGCEVEDLYGCGGILGLRVESVDSGLGPRVRSLKVGQRLWI